MKFALVTKDDMKMFQQLINMVQIAELSLNGKDVCATADTIRWLQKVAVGAAECFQASLAPKPEPPVPPTPVAAAKPPTGGFEEGVTIKSFNPGKTGKK